MAPQKILIIGCSIAGPSLAAFLLLSDLPAAQKPQITIIERAEKVREEGQNIDVRGAGVTICQKLGIEKAIRAATTGEAGVKFVDAQDRTWASFAAGKPGEDGAPTAEIEILRGSLAKICTKSSERASELVKNAGGSGIEYIFGEYVDQIEQDDQQVTVHFARRNENRSFDLVVGADGLQSRARAMVWGEGGETDRIKRLGMYGAFFTIPKEESDGIWRRWFHASGRRGIMTRPSENKDMTTVFMYTINEQDPRLREVASHGRRDVNAQKALLSEYFRDAGWESERIIREMMHSKDFYYDMVAQTKLDKWYKGRVVLLGDAAYCASPISGMGTTLALSGAYNLAGALTQHGQNYTTAFAQFQERMQPNVDRAQKLAPGMPYLINPETTWGVWVLNAVMYVLDQSGLIGLVARFAGPQAQKVPVEDYGFHDLPEFTF